MRKRNPVPQDLSPDPVSLASAAVHSLIQRLPSGTAFFIGVVLIVMMTGRLVYHKGSLARAALPFVVHLRWGWHRVERAMERGKVVLDVLFDHAHTWCVANLPVEPVRLGSEERELVALDTSTIARLRAGARLALAGKGFCHRAGRAVRANIVAAATSIVMIRGVRVGLVRRTRFGARCEDAVETLFHALPPSESKRLIIVDAGIATQERFAAATDQDALLGRLRINSTLRGAPPLPSGTRGHPTWHGAVLHPGALAPEVEPAEECLRPSDKGDIRVRRWNALHFEETRHTILDVLRIDDPAYQRPLVVGTTARELTTEEFLRAYPHRWPVETNFFVAQDTTAMEMPRAWTATALERRISLSLLSGSLLQAIAAATGPVAMGPWDRKPMPSAGRLANYLESHAANFSALALKGVEPRNYRIIHEHAHLNELQQPKVKFRRTQYPHYQNQHIPEKSGITFSMQSTHSNVNAISDLATGNGNDATPFSQQSVVLTKQAYIELTWKANYWQAQHARSVEREAALMAKVASLEATIRDFTQRLYGTKSEKSAGPDDAAESKPSRSRHRGQQPGSKGHGRSERSALLVVPEVHDLSPAQLCCPACGEAFAPFPGAEASTIIEVQVQAHLRRIQRRRYQKTCECPQVPGIVTAPPAPRVIPKSPLGVSLWTTVLLDKYLYGRPTYRLCEQLTHHGLPLSPGTLTDGLQKIAVLFEPVMTKLYERQMSEKRFHGDETRWEVFEDVAGKTGHRWYLWVMQSASVVFYRMAPGRGADVPIAHFAKLHKDLVDVVLVCDRYSAYKCLAKACDDLILAFCWAHVRRDFLKAARSWPELESWMFTWVKDIRELYRLNAARLEMWEETLRLNQQPSAFVERHRDLETRLSQMQARCEAHLQEPDLHLVKHKVLSSLHTHWDGLTVFVERPEVAMDNNTAERILRNPVVGRKNYYGSGSVWSAHLAARMFSVLQTILLWGLNPHHWLTAFLQACAENGGTSPTDLSAFLPWQMAPERREELARPVPVTLPPFAGLCQEREEAEAADTS